ncbi:MAG: diguanylate cyclase, partial [Desulfobacteraceae bacterium]|nr:diguanylate cyclase [Desulfobacteraceae bacterium]
KDILSSQKEICLSHARSIEDAFALLGQEDLPEFDLIFLDFILGNGTGFDFFKKAAEKNLQIPVVVITGQGNEVISAKLIQAGASDYLPKSKIGSQSLSRIISNALEKSRLKRDLMQMQARLVETSTKDDLTGLFNRRFFMETLENEMERAERYNENLSLLMIDIDHFKKVNDIHGHPIGDIVLSNVAKVFLSCVRKSDFVGRVGGEEFGIILTQTGKKEALTAGEKIRKAVEETQFSNFEFDLKVTISIGVSIYETTMNTDILVKNADDMLYLAKLNGRNQVRV